MMVETKGIKKMAETNVSDMIARKAPDWLPKSVIYQVYLRSFTPEGTLTAAARKLPELAAMGIDIVYLCPVCLQDDDVRKEYWSSRQIESGLNNPQNPYRIKDYYNLDPEYGTDDDLRAFVDTCHELGMKVMLDIVFFHCGPTAVFLEEHPDFVKHDDDGVVLGYWRFPELDFDNPELRNYLIKNLEYWVRDFGVDGYRCDVSFQVPLDFWEEARVRLDTLNPELIFLAESAAPEEQLKAFDVSYGFMLECTYRFDKVLLDGEPASFFRETWHEDAGRFPHGARFLRYTENHDIAHDTRDRRKEAAWGFDGMNATFVLNFTLDGVPMVYNGQEVTDTAAHSIYGNFPIEWERADTGKGRSRRELITALCRLRHNEAALADGDVVWVDNSSPGQELAFLRAAGDERILVVLNFSRNGVTSTIKLGSASAEGATELLKLGVGTWEAEGNQLAMDLSGYGCLLLKLSGLED